MSTPVTLKQMEQAREKAARRQRLLDSAGLPLSMQVPHQNLRRFPMIDFTADKAGGRQYTSFEGSRKDSDPRGPQKPLSPPLVEDVPIEVDTHDYAIDPNNIVSFSGRQHFLSNLFPITLLVDGHTYPSVEHYYQACKLFTLGGPQYATYIRYVTDPGQVKSTARRILRSAGIQQERINEWRRVQGPDLLIHAIQLKYGQNADLREKLLETKDAILAHTYERDNLYATGCDKDYLTEWAKSKTGHILKIPTKLDCRMVVYVPLIGKGKNLLGCINMMVRKQIRDSQADNLVVSDPVMSVSVRSLRLEPKKEESQ